MRRTGGRLIRRWGLLPAGEPDGLGDDEALHDRSLPFSVMVYFPDPPRNLYQLRQWFGPLRRLDDRHRVGIVCLDSRTAATVRAECELPVLCVARIGTLEGLVSRSDVALALYVNHNVRNLHPLRFPTMLHAYVGHGESDKIASASNQVKAYDVVLVAGDVGRERLRRNLLRYDVERHVRLVGRPQLDDTAPAPAISAATGSSRRPTVLYAPTWEGAQPAMAYSSVVSHGEAMLRSLLQSGDVDVVYRPHPRTGANRAEFAAADERLRALLAQHRQADPAGRYDVDLSSGWDPRRDPADLLISDISAVATDWMTTGKPLLVTVPESPAAFIDADTVLAAVPGISSDQAAAVDAIVTRELAGGDARRREAWVRRAMGDIAPGAATAQFLAVCDELVALRGQELEQRAARLSGARA